MSHILEVSDLEVDVYKRQVYLQAVPTEKKLSYEDIVKEYNK